MPATLVQTSPVGTGGYGIPTPASLGSLPAPGNVVFAVGVWNPAYGSAPTSVSVTDNLGNTYTVLAFASTANQNGCFIAWCVAGSSAGTFTASVSVTGGAADAGVSFALQEWSGLDTAALLDQVGSGIQDWGSAFSVTAAAPNAAADRLVFAVLSGRNNTNITAFGNNPPATGFTSIFSQPTGVFGDPRGVAAYKVVSSIETSSADWGVVASTAGGQGPMLIATFAVATGGGGSTVSEVTSLSMAVQLAQAAAASVGLAVQAPLAATTSVSMAVRAAQTASAAVAAAVQQASSASTLVGLAVRDAHTASLGSDLAVQAVHQASADLALAIQVAQSAGFGVDLQVQAAAEASTSVSLQIQAGASASAAIQIAVQHLVTAAASLSMAVSQSLSSGVGVDAGVQVARSDSASADLAVQAEYSGGFGVDLQVQEGSTRALALQAAVQFAVDASTAVSVAVAQLQAAGVGLSAAISLQNTLGVALGCAVLASAARSMGVSLYIEGDDPPETYPLAGFTQGYPLAGQSQTYPLAR